MWLLKQIYKIDFYIHHVYLTAKQTISLAVCVTERVVYLPRLIYLFNKLVFISLMLLQIFFPPFCASNACTVLIFWVFLKYLVQISPYLTSVVQ